MESLLLFVFAFTLILPIYVLMYNDINNNKISKECTSEQKHFHNNENHSSKEKTTNYYTQNNIYLQNNYANESDDEIYDELTKNQKKVKVLGTALVKSTNSKRKAKDILVDKYDFDESTAKYAVGYDMSYNSQSTKKRKKIAYSKSRSSESHTYDVWQELGFQVKRGERSSYKYYGKHMFTRDQVVMI